MSEQISNATMMAAVQLSETRRQTEKAEAAVRISLGMPVMMVASSNHMKMLLRGQREHWLSKLSRWNSSG